MGFYASISIPDGEYRGLWGGYRIKFEHDGKEIIADTKIGIRGIDIPCVFKIVSGNLDEKSIQKK